MMVEDPSFATADENRNADNEEDDDHNDDDDTTGIELQGLLGSSSVSSSSPLSPHTHELRAGALTATTARIRERRRTTRRRTRCGSMMFVLCFVVGSTYLYQQQQHRSKPLEEHAATITKKGGGTSGSIGDDEDNTDYTTTTTNKKNNSKNMNTNSNGNMNMNNKNKKKNMNNNDNKNMNSNGNGTGNKNNNYKSVSSQQQPNERPPQCTRAQLQKGQWIKTNETVPINEQETCKNKDYLTGGYSTNYEWEPQDDYNRTCEFGKWDANAFCSLVTGATIMIVGDSLSFEHYINMMSSLGRHGSPLLQRRSYQKKMTLVQDVCNSSNDRQTTTQTQPAVATYVTYRRDDNLKNLASILEEKFPIILILNRGAHYTQDDKLLSDLQDTFLHVQNWQTKCKQQYGIKCHFFWRTTVPGHPGCQTFTEPVNNITQMEELVRTKSIVGGGQYTQVTQYHWAQFQGQNVLVLNELQKWSSRIDYQVIDAYSVNILRPDQHRAPGTDCLHGCDSGKIQVYNRLMLHYLSGSRTLKDIQILQDFQHPWNRTTNIQPNGTDIINAMAPPL